MQRNHPSNSTRPLPALERIHEIEQQLSVYRADSELSEINRIAFHHPVVPDPQLFELLLRSQQLSEITHGAFDAAAGALVHLWRCCRQESRIPTQAEIDETLLHSGTLNVQFDPEARSVSFLREGVDFTWAIGKGYAVDRAGDQLLSRGISNWLVHGGRSSVLAHGAHAAHDGWPIGLRNPLLPDKPFATLLLKNSALEQAAPPCSGFATTVNVMGISWILGHGWPIESLLSVSVIVPDAALADALSTAFFVLGVEKSLECCDNLPASAGDFFPLPRQGQTLEPILHNVPENQWFTT